MAARFYVLRAMFSLCPVSWLTDKQGTQLVPAPPHLTPLSSIATALRAHQDLHSVPDYRVIFPEPCWKATSGFCLQPKPRLDPKLCLDFESFLAFCKPLLCLAYLLPTFFCSVT